MQGSTVVAAPLQVAGHEWSVTCVSMGNPHAVVFTRDSADFKVQHLRIMPARRIGQSRHVLHTFVLSASLFHTIFTIAKWGRGTL